MPNHITTVCSITGSPAAVLAFRSAHIVPEKNERTEETHDQFSLDSIVPMPPCVKDTIRDMKSHFGDLQVEMYARGLTDKKFLNMTGDPDVKSLRLPPEVQTWSQILAWLDEKHPGIDKPARAELRCAAETGHSGWYDWSVANWGTKWDSYDYVERSAEPEKFVFEFQTAWSFPKPVFEKLAELHPELVFEVEAIDEGGGEFEGRYAGRDKRFRIMANDRDRYVRVYGREPYSED